MRKRKHLDTAQLVLHLERQNPEHQLKGNPKGLVEALADLLLEALGVVGSTTTKGGGDEQQDHA